MSLAITVYVQQGIVMASDSRQSIIIETKNPQGEYFKTETINSDAVDKTFLLEKQQVGITIFGVDMLGKLPTVRYIRRFIDEELAPADDIETIPRKLCDYFRKRFPDANTGFHVSGYKIEKRKGIPYVYFCHVANNIVERKNVKDDGSIVYGALWSGVIDVVNSILNPVTIKDEQGADKVIRAPEPIIWDAMTLQDAIDFSIYAIRTTIDTMRFQARPKNVGGPIDVLILTRYGAKWISKKELHG